MSTSTKCFLRCGSLFLRQMIMEDTLFFRVETRSSHGIKRISTPQYFFLKAEATNPYVNRRLHVHLSQSNRCAVENVRSWQEIRKAQRLPLSTYAQQLRFPLFIIRWKGRGRVYSPYARPSSSSDFFSNGLIEKISTLGSIDTSSS